MKTTEAIEEYAGEKATEILNGDTTIEDGIIESIMFWTKADYFEKYQYEAKLNQELLSQIEDLKNAMKMGSELSKGLVFDDDEEFKLAELLADEAYGNKGIYLYSECQELTVKFSKIIKQYTHKIK